MTKCKWDREAEAYLADGEPCKRDEYGDPTKHCTARRSCSNHVGADEQTCPRCIARVRSNLRRIPALSALMLPVAITAGVNSEAANLAGPATSPVGWRERRVAQRWHLDAWEELGRITERQHLHALETMEDDDSQHPYNVLTRWQMMIAEDYGHDLPERLTIVGAADYLDRQLARIAQDPEQDFPLLGSDLRRCRQHLETAVSLRAHKERGEPCPECRNEGQVNRLVREYGHWCEDEGCERIHYDDDSADVWVCPRNRDHEWSHEDYSRWVEERKGA